MCRIGFLDSSPEYVSLFYDPPPIFSYRVPIEVLIYYCKSMLRSNLIKWVRFVDIFEFDKASCVFLGGGVSAMQSAGDFWFGAEK